MSFDVESLLTPLSDETPSGENLEYDPEYIELEMAAERKPDQQFGDTIVPGEEPDWSDVANRAVSLLGRTRDLRVAIHLVQAALRNEGFPGFRDALAVIDGYLERLWDSVHPQLDPDDDLDPTMRVNLLRTLCNVQAVIRPVREAPLARSRMLGIASTQLVQSADAPRGEEGGEAGPSRGDLDAIFMDCDLDEFRATVEALREAARLVRHIEATLTDRVGAGSAFDMSPLLSALKEADGIAGAWLVRRDGSGDAATEDAAGGGTGVQETGSGGGASPAPGRAMRAGVHSREDVLRGLDEMIRFFEANEPTSPVPLLLGRAKRWMTMDFLGILEDFSPEAAREAEKLRGGG